MSTERKRRTIADKVKKEWWNDKNLSETQLYIYIKLPDQNDHVGHFAGDVRNQMTAIFFFVEKKSETRGS